MIELAFDIAPGANYKFNSASLGEQASLLQYGQGCEPNLKNGSIVFPCFPQNVDRCRWSSKINRNLKSLPRFLVCFR